MVVDDVETETIADDKAPGSTFVLTIANASAGCSHIDDFGGFF